MQVLRNVRLTLALGGNDNVMQILRVEGKVWLNHLDISLSLVLREGSDKRP